MLRPALPLGIEISHTLARSSVRDDLGDVDPISRSLSTASGRADFNPTEDLLGTFNEPGDRRTAAIEVDCDYILLDGARARRAFDAVEEKLDKPLRGGTTLAALFSRFLQKEGEIDAIPAEA